MMNSKPIEKENLKEQINCDIHDTGNQKNCSQWSQADTTRPLPNGGKSYGIGKSSDERNCSTMIELTNEQIKNSLSQDSIKYPDQETSVKTVGYIDDQAVSHNAGDNQYRTKKPKLSREATLKSSASNDSSKGSEKEKHYESPKYFEQEIVESARKDVNGNLIPRPAWGQRAKSMSPASSFKKKNPDSNYNTTHRKGSDGHRSESIGNKFVNMWSGLIKKYQKSSGESNSTEENHDEGTIRVINRALKKSSSSASFINNNRSIGRNPSIDSGQICTSYDKYLDFFWNQDECPLFMIPRLGELTKPIKCNIYSVDGSLLREVLIYEHEVGQVLLDQVMNASPMVETLFYGLKLIETNVAFDDTQSAWIELDKKILKQVSARAKDLREIFKERGQELSRYPSKYSTRSLDFLLRFRYYPPKMEYLKGQPKLRDYLWLQLLRDLRLSRLVSSLNNMEKLLAYYLEHEYETFSKDPIGQLKLLNLFPGQSAAELGALEKFNNRTAVRTKEEMKNCFIQACMKLQTYGCDLYSVTHHNKPRSKVILCFNYMGIKCIEELRIVIDLPWFSYEQVRDEQRTILIHHMNPRKPDQVRPQIHTN